MNVVSVLEEVTGALEPHAARAGVSIDATFKDWDVPIVCVDRTRYRQILMNFASNAIKIQSLGRQPGVFVLARGVRAPHYGDRHWNGHSARAPARSFQPFRRAGQENGPKEGTGIGLSISKHLAELMGGSVGFSSVLREGSAFWVEVPVHRANLRSGPPPAPVEGIPNATDKSGLEALLVG